VVARRKGSGVTRRGDDDEELELVAAETGQIPVVDLAAAAAARDRIPREIWVLIGATFFVAIGFALVVPVLPQYAESFGVGAFLVSVVVSAFAFMRFLTAPFGGVLVDRFGERPMYIAGLLIVAASSFASAFATSYVELLIYRGLGGIGSALFTLSASAMVVRYSPPRIRGRVTSLWSGTFLVGNITGPVFGGLLGQAGMAVPFFVYGCGLVVAAGIVAALLRGVGTRGTATTTKLPPISFGEALKLPAYPTSLAFGFANGWAVLGMRAAVVPLFVSQVSNDEPYAAGLVVAAAAIGMVIVLQWSGHASDRHGRRPFILAGLVVSIASTLGMIWSHELWVVLLVSLAAGVGSGLCGPVSQAAVGDIIGPHRSGGRALSLYQMVQDLGQITGPLIAGLIIDLWGFEWAFAVAALVLVLPAAAWLGTRDTVPREAPGA
jgi:MFS family permease